MLPSSANTNSGRAEKRITTGQRVSGAHGPLVPNPNPKIKRRVHQRIHGRVLEAIGSAKYRIQFDDGVEKICASRTLRTERNEIAIPLAEVPLTAARTAVATSSTAASSTEGPSTAASLTTAGNNITEGEDVDGDTHNGTFT